MKVRYLFTVVIFVAALSPASAQEPNAPKPTGRARFGDPTAMPRNLQNYIYGVVKKVAKQKLILDKTEFGDDQPFKLDPKTRYVRDGKPGKLEDLKVGDQVFVQVKKNKKSGDMIAKSVVSGAEGSSAGP
jgi:hypothetical protein